MLTTSSASQYLHPDYLQPLPTTLDAKKSPLALLAQTCSSIGKDTPPNKPIIPPLEKKESDKYNDKNSDQKRPSSSDDRKDSGRDSKPGFRTVPPKEIPPLVPISSGSSEKNSSSVSESGKSSSETTTVSNVITRPVSSTGSNSSGHGSIRGSEKGEHHDHPTSHSTSPHHIKPSSAHSTPILPTPQSLGSLKQSMSHPSLLGALPTAPHLAYSALPLMGHHGLHVDVQASSPAYHHSSLAAHASLTAAAAQSSALKASAAAAAATSAALSPYVAYARVRTPSGATTLVPVCRDPYCTNCQLTLQNSHLSSTCTSPGCSQCAHEKSLTSLTSGLGLPGASSLSILPPLSSAGTLASSASGLSSFHSLYQHSALASHQGLPYICNWVAGSEYCGKRFTTSEELLQHLRTHTSSMDATSLAANYGLGLPSALSACHGHYPAPAPLSPNSLRRSYPTSLSPVSSLLGANRYHPYKSPLASVPTAPAQAYPALSPYYSPYALYGQRLGAAAVP